MKTTSLVTLLIASVQFTGYAQESKTNGSPAKEAVSTPAATAEVTPKNGFSHTKDAPNVVSGIKDWDYPGIYYPIASGAKSTQKVKVRVTASATANPDGSIHWWSFHVAKIYSDSNPNQSLAFEVIEENPDSPANRPIIIIEGKYRLAAKVTSIQQILFEQEPEKESK